MCKNQFRPDGAAIGKSGPVFSTICAYLWGGNIEIKKYFR
jgi:hypothetical protein